MIPTAHEVKALWETYHLSDGKRHHCKLVAKVAVFFATAMRAKNLQIDIDLLRAAALLHDIDKGTPQLPGERHPDAAVRLLKNEGMPEVASVVKTHSLHTILDAGSAPKTREEKLLYLADKMVKHDVIGIDERFSAWRAEHLPPQAVAELNAAYPKVRELQREICVTCGFTPRDVTNLVRKGILHMS